MPKNIIHAVEDCIIPIILKDLVRAHIRAMPQYAPRWKDWLDNINTVLGIEEYEVTPKLRQSFRQIYKRISNRVIDYMEQEQFRVTKGLMIMTIIAQEIQLPKEIEVICQEVTDIIAGKLCTDNFDVELDKLLESAKKQAPKVLGIIQKFGYLK